MDAVLKPSRKDHDQSGLGLDLERLPEGESLEIGERRGRPGVHDFKHTVHGTAGRRLARRDMIDGAPLVARLDAKRVVVAVAVDVGPSAAAMWDLAPGDGTAHFRA